MKINSQKIMVAVIWFTFAGMVVGTGIHYASLYLGFASSTIMPVYTKALFGVIASMGFILFFLIPKGERPLLPKGWTLIFSLALSVFVLGMVMAFFRLNSIRYVVGDAFRYGLTWLSLYVYICCIGGLIKAGKINTIYSIIEGMAIIAVVSSIFAIYMARQFPLAKISVVTPIIGLCWAIFQNRRSWIFSVLCFVICLAGMLLSGKRGIFVALIVMSPMILLFFGITLIKSVPLRVKIKKYGLSLIAGALLCCILFLVFAPLVQISSTGFGFELYKKRFNVMVNSVLFLVSEERSTDISWQGRLGEAEVIKSFYMDNGGLILVGAGFGAEIEPTQSGMVLTESGKMHHVHIGWFLYLLRNGLIGLLLYAVFWVKIFSLIIKRHGPQYSNWVFMFIILLVYFFIGSLKGNNMIGDNLTPFCTAILLGFIGLSQASKTQGNIIMGNGK